MTKFNLTIAEYTKLIQDFYNDQYEDNDERTSEQDIIMGQRLVEAAIKKQSFRSPPHNGTTDLTNIKSDKIKENLLLSQNFKVGKFLIKIKKWNTAYNLDDGVDISIYEDTKDQTASGKIFATLKKVDVIKDNRFKGRLWISQFDRFQSGNGITYSTLIDIVRWLQAMTKLTCFL